MRLFQLPTRFAVFVAATVLFSHSAAAFHNVPSVQDLWATADEELAVGHLIGAERALREATLRSNTETERAMTSLRLAVLFAASGRVEEAGKEVDAVAARPGLVEPATLLSVQAGVEARSGDLVRAEDLFEQAATASHSSGDPVAEARARLNALRTRVDRQELQNLEERLQSVHERIFALPAGRDRTVMLLAIGDLQRRAVNELRSPQKLRMRAYQAFLEAQREAQTASLRAYAVGYLGALYQDEGRVKDGLRLSLEAVYIAQGGGMGDDQAFRWEWQAEKAQRLLGQTIAAEASITRAVEELDPVRSDVLRSSRQAFRTLIEPVYMDYADLQLQHAATFPDGSQSQQRLLREVRDRLESLKQSEIQDYFERECFATANTSQSSQLRLRGVAIVYPIVLPDRLEVLFDTAEGLRRYAAPVSKGELTAVARHLRISLEQPNSGDEYLEPATRLYRWLLADAKPWLDSLSVHTLIFVPAGPLRTVPLSALYDGSQFVIERYAVGTTPAMSLLTPKSADPVKRVFVGGLTKSVQGFSQLPSVATEMRSIAAVYPGESIQDESFQLRAVKSHLSTPGFTAVHLATHGEFSADHRQSFVLTYDQRLTLDDLQSVLSRRSTDPLELLVLSACRTAAGDDRAALGLAGVAIEAGAQSALASLWYVRDQASAVLMAHFYRSLKSGASKAESLQQAQLALLRKPEYRHPSYWAPFLMIGDWT